MDITWFGHSFLCAVMLQAMGICWAITLVRQLEFLLKMNNKMPIDKHLSIQDFIDRVPKEILWIDGGAPSEDPFIYLREFGVLLEDQCPLTQSVTGSVSSATDRRPRYHPLELEVYHAGVLSFERFHSKIVNLLREGQIVTIRIPAYWSYFGSYGKSNGKDIYYPTPLELRRLKGRVPRNGHYILAIGSGRDAEGRLYYKCQDSYGVEFADAGYSLIYADLVTSYVQMSLGENVLF